MPCQDIMPELVQLRTLTTSFEVGQSVWKRTTSATAGIPRGTRGEVQDQAYLDTKHPSGHPQVRVRVYWFVGGEQGVVKHCTLELELSMVAPPPLFLNTLWHQQPTGQMNDQLYMATDVCDIEDADQWVSSPLQRQKALENRTQCTRYWPKMQFRAGVDAFRCLPALLDVAEGWDVGLCLVEFPWPWHAGGDRDHSRRWAADMHRSLAAQWRNAMVVMLVRDCDVEGSQFTKRQKVHRCRCHYMAQRMTDEEDVLLEAEWECCAVVQSPLAGVNWLPGSQQLPAPVHVPDLVARCLFSQQAVLHFAAYTLDSPVQICRHLGEMRDLWHL
jgi:hypothetical protein